VRYDNLHGDEDEIEQEYREMKEQKWLNQEEEE
jgi:hypothetical protein